MAAIAAAVDDVDALVIGGGFYGCSIALALKHDLGLDRIALAEREPALMRRASYVNQARLHTGYHYPRSLTTATRSRINLPRFRADYADCVVDRFQSLYAVARQNSKVSGRQFAKFCRQIGAQARPAPPSLQRLFSDRLIESVFLVDEQAFDAGRLRQRMTERLAEANIDVHLETRVDRIDLGEPGGIGAELAGPAGRRRLRARQVFNCSYAGLNSIPGLGETRAGLKFEIAEMALLEPPEALRDIAVTVMDGPFFSVMPFPGKGLHSLSHVRYTPHFSWTAGEGGGATPDAVLAAYGKPSRAGQMLRDAGRYLPCLAGTRPSDILFEVKTVLASNEVDDGRPILLERHRNDARCVSVLGGKIDNVYDVCALLRSLPELGGSPRHGQ